MHWVALLPFWNGMTQMPIYSSVRSSWWPYYRRSTMSMQEVANPERTWTDATWDGLRPSLFAVLRACKWSIYDCRYMCPDTELDRVPSTQMGLGWIVFSPDYWWRQRYSSSTIFKFFHLFCFCKIKQHMESFQFSFHKEHKWPKATSMESYPVQLL